MAKSITTRRAGLCALAFAALAGPLAMLCGVHAADPPCVFPRPIPFRCEESAPPDGAQCSEVDPGGNQGACLLSVQYVHQSGLFRCPEQTSVNPTHTCGERLRADGTAETAPCLSKFRCRPSILPGNCEMSPNPEAASERVVYFTAVCAADPVQPPRED